MEKPQGTKGWGLPSPPCPFPSSHLHLGFVVPYHVIGGRVLQERVRESLCYLSLRLLYLSWHLQCSEPALSIPYFIPPATPLRQGSVPLYSRGENLRAVKAPTCPGFARLELESRGDLECISLFLNEHHRWGSVVTQKPCHTAYKYVTG